MDDGKWMKVDWWVLAVVSGIVALFIGVVAALVEGCAQPERPPAIRCEPPCTQPVVLDPENFR